MAKLTVNNVVREHDAEGDTPLLWVLREQLGLTGTKYGCGLAQCGACTVHIDGVPTRSCVRPVSTVQPNEKIVTIEGLSQKISHPVQKAWRERKAARERGETPFAPVAEKLCALGRYGQKTKGGWYDYHDGDRTPHVSSITAACISDAAHEMGIQTHVLKQDAIVHALLFPMINEGAEILDAQIAQRAVDIDLVEIHGYGFPRRTGGPMHFAVAHGLPDVVATLDQMARDGLAEPPCDLLRRAASAGSWSALGF